MGVKGDIKMQRDKIIHSFAEAIRPLTPDEKGLTDFEVISQWEPYGLLFSAESYGDEICTCGHEIRHVFEVRLIDNPFVRYSPVGSVCIESIFGCDTPMHKAVKIECDLRKIYSHLTQRKREWGVYGLDEEEVTAENGFSEVAVDWLAGRLDTKKISYLRQLQARRKCRAQTEKQSRFLEWIGEEIIRAIRKAENTRFALK